MVDIDDACNEVVAEDAGLCCDWRYAFALCLHLGRGRRGRGLKIDGACAIRFDA